MATGCKRGVLFAAISTKECNLVATNTAYRPFLCISLRGFNLSAISGGEPMTNELVKIRAFVG